MRILVAYDSVFGNTEQVARAIGNALEGQGDVQVLQVDDVGPEQLAGVDLLIVGSPTRAFRPTPATSNLLKRIPANGLRGVRVAAFDTRISASDIDSRIGRFLVSRLGYAAPPILSKLQKKGGDPAAGPEGFIVEGTEGPLREGELERAADWARQLVAT